MAIDDYADVVRDGGKVLASTHVHYDRGRTVVSFGWSVFDRHGKLVHADRMRDLGGDFLEALQEASVEHCLTWDWAHNTFTHPRLPF